MTSYIHSSHNKTMCSHAMINNIFLLENTQWSSGILGLNKQKKKPEGGGEEGAGQGQDGEGDKVYVRL